MQALARTCYNKNSGKTLKAVLALIKSSIKPTKQLTII
jgi:hypothetical protein